MWTCRRLRINDAFLFTSLWWVRRHKSKSNIKKWLTADRRWKTTIIWPPLSTDFDSSQTINSFLCLPNTFIHSLIEKAPQQCSLVGQEMPKDSRFPQNSVRSMIAAKFPKSKAAPEWIIHLKHRFKHNCVMRKVYFRRSISLHTRSFITVAYNRVWWWKLASLVGIWETNVFQYPTAAAAGPSDRWRQQQPLQRPEQTIWWRQFDHWAAQQRTASYVIWSIDDCVKINCRYSTKESILEQGTQRQSTAILAWKRQQRWRCAKFLQCPTGTSLGHPARGQSKQATIFYWIHSTKSIWYQTIINSANRTLLTCTHTKGTSTPPPRSFIVDGCIRIVGNGRYRHDECLW